MYKFTERWLCTLLNIEQIKYKKTTKRKVVTTLLYSGTLVSLLLHLLSFGGQMYLMFFYDGADIEITYLVVFKIFAKVADVLVALLLTALVPNMFRTYLHIKDASARNKLIRQEELNTMHSKAFPHEP